MLQRYRPEPFCKSSTFAVVNIKSLIFSSFLSFCVSRHLTDRRRVRREANRTLPFFIFSQCHSLYLTLSKCSSSLNIITSGREDGNPRSTTHHNLLYMTPVQNNLETTSEVKIILTSIMFPPKCVCQKEISCI